MAPEFTGNDNNEVHSHERIAVLLEKVTTLKDDLINHEEQCERSKAEIYSRLGKIERLAYLAIGGIVAIGGIANFFGWNILKLLGK